MSTPEINTPLTLARMIFTTGVLGRYCDPVSASNTAGTFKDTSHYNIAAED